MRVAKMATKPRFLVANKKFKLHWWSQFRTPLSRRSSYKNLAFYLFNFQPLVSSFSTTSPTNYKPRTSNISHSPARMQRSKSPLRSTSPSRRSASPSMHRATSPRLHNTSHSPGNKQVRHFTQQCLVSCAVIVWICHGTATAEGGKCYVMGPNNGYMDN